MPSDAGPSALPGTETVRVSSEDELALLAKVLNDSKRTTILAAQAVLEPTRS